ncbi:MAG TPA: DUF1501 domain-containing protein, partial [Isosphaeraceae bacterium]|nr:DUF1501 domain-containing protein [Isosphaeraceae bacterium]
GGLTLPGLLRSHAAGGAEVRPGHSPRARSVIILFLSGGPSQLDMWDMKPEAPEEVRGTFRPIATDVPGVQICEHMPRMARLAGRYTIVRSMSHSDADHLRAGYWVMTGGRLARPVVQASGMSREDRPHVGAVVSRFLGGSTTMPPFAMIPEFISPVGVPRPGQYGGFLGAEHDPYLINSDPNLPEYSPGELRPASDLDPLRLTRRRSLLRRLEQRVRSLEESAAGRNLDPYYARAFDLIASPAAQRAFDVRAESPATRDRYGRHVFGQSTLVARRLIEAGVRLVQVNFVRHDRGKGGQGYDSHSVPPNPPHLSWAKSELLPPTDAAFSALVEDLAERGLLDETLVIMMGEFGRTPRFNRNGGRDHWPQCYSAVLAGGGVRGGHVHGASDRLAATVTSDPVSPEDLLATLYHLLGLDPTTPIQDRQGRPFPLAAGKPVAGLLLEEGAPSPDSRSLGGSPGGAGSYKPWGTLR